jgi:serine protease Do
MRKVALLVGLSGVAAWFMSGPAHADGPSPGQRLAVQTKPAVVRVVAGYLVDVDMGQGKTDRRFIGGHGSGFFVDPEGYLVTNAHVVDFVHGGDEKAHAKIVADLLAQVARQNNVDLNTLPAERRQELNRLASQAVRIAKRVSIIILPNGDQLVYDIKAFGQPVGLAGVKDVAILKVQTRNAPTLMLGDESSVQLQDKVYAIGYPGAADDLVGVLDEKAMLEATITDGNVSAIKKSADGVPVIQVTTVISPGNSGGPALNEKGEVVGLATFKAAQAEGYNFLVPASTVKEFIRQAGIENKDSLTNQAFRNGLKLHWEQRYSEAIKEFEEVRQLFPAHSEVAHLITEAQEAKRQGKEKKPEETSSAAVIVAISCGGVVALGLIFLVIVRRKPAPAHRPLHGMAPGYGPPPMAHGGHAHAPHPAAPHHAPPHPSSPHPAPGSGPGGFQKTVAVSPNAGGAALAGLVCIRGILRGQHFSLGAHGLTIGRDSGSAQVVIQDGRVSSKHVWIGFQDGRLIAVDQGSTNGTFVNDMGRGRITRVELKHGDTVIVSEPDVLTLNVLLSSR